MTGIRSVAAFAALAVMLAACGINMNDPKQLKQSPTDELCEDYYFGRQPAVDTKYTWPTKQDDIKKELNRRHAVEVGDWAWIDQGRIQNGMNECALRAAWGYPLRVDHTTTEAGMLAHYVYQPARDVYVTNGKITSFKY